MTTHTPPGRTPRIIGSLGVIAGLAIVTWVALRPGKDDVRDRESDEMSAMAGMDMSANGSVRLLAQQIRDFGITFDFVEERSLASEVRTVGIVDFDETRVSAITPKFSGFVETLFVNFSGQAVRKGEPLVEIYAPELVAAQEDLLLAAGLEKRMGMGAVPGAATVSNLVDASRERLRLLDISDAQIDEILRSGVSQRTLTLMAPFSGVVVEKNVRAGQAVQAGETIYLVADLSRIWVNAELRERDAALIREGAAARIELSAFPGRRIEGRVAYVDPVMHRDARTIAVRIVVSNPDGRLKPGMFATVLLSVPAGDALSVPITAVVQTGERNIVFVDVGAGVLLPVEVELGRIAGDHAEVLTGLEPGQRVVTSAQFLLESESNLAEVMKAMMSQMNMSDMESMEMDDVPAGADMRGMDMRRREQ